MLPRTQIRRRKMPRDTGQHTLDKLRILRQYLPVYLQATKGVIERVYVDAFAGPGRNRIRETNEVVDGSPLIALDAKAKNGTRFDRYIFIEMNRDTAHELETVLAEREDARRIQVIRGDVNVELPRVIRTINQRSPTFVFLDTDGIEPAWRTIEEIAPWRTELLINFPLGMGINRNMDSHKIGRYFGTPEARTIWDSAAPNWRRQLIDLYKRRLQDLGYSSLSDLDRLIKTRGGQYLYYLIHVSKVEAAKRIMRWIQKQPDSDGQMQLPL